MNIIGYHISDVIDQITFTITRITISILRTIPFILVLHFILKPKNWQDIVYACIAYTIIYLGIKYLFKGKINE